VAKRKRTAVKSGRTSTRPSARRAITVGRSMAAEVLRFRDSALRRRAAALRRAPVIATRRAVSHQLIHAAGGPERAGVLVAEGDSWFDYPWHDVLRMLEDHHGYDVESVAHKGDTIESMAYGGQLEELTRTIEKLLRQGIIPSAILLSGGGNDVAGGEFRMLINHARSAHPGLNEQVITGVIDERVFDAYVTILTGVTMVCRQRTGRIIPIVIHGYGRPVPDGRGVLGGWGPLPGPWLQPGFRDKGFGTLTTCAKMAADLLDRFNAMLRRLAALPEFGHVRYVDVRDDLSNGADYRTWWGNELHPTRRGFEVVAERFAAAI
jgi:GDSL-like lipase/acylhydrolase family protein